MKYPKRLIEVDLPIARISAHARREKSIRHGHISTLHIWWARRPLAACRAVICAALWPDPADALCPDSFVEVARREMLSWASHERQRLLSEASRPRFEAARKNSHCFDNPEELRSALLDFIADFANWDNSTVQEYLDASRALTQAAHEALGGAPGTRPLIVDPFAGGGSIPLEALRVGAEAFASDLNPVAVLLNKVILEYLPKYGQRLANEVRKCGEWIKREAEIELAEFYPKDSDGSRPVAYLWARTIRCDGPGCGAEIPLIRSLWLANKGKRSLGLRLIPDANVKNIAIEIVESKTIDSGTVRLGSVTCPVCIYTTPVANVRAQISNRKGGAADARLMAVVVETPTHGKRYRLPHNDDLAAVERAQAFLQKRLAQNGHSSSTLLDEPTPPDGTGSVGGGYRTRKYGITTYRDFFTPRQLLEHLTITSLINPKYKELRHAFENGELADAIVSVMALAGDKQADRDSAFCRWICQNQAIGYTFGRQAIPMLWDFVESPAIHSSGGWTTIIDDIAETIEYQGKALSPSSTGSAHHSSATHHALPDGSCACLFTDPPYYDAVPYAELSDFFYVWLKRSLKNTGLLAGDSLLTPKDLECVVNLQESKDRQYFQATMTRALAEGNRILMDDGIGVVVFAHKSTAGWEAQIQAMINSGWIITGSWPIDTERPGRLRAQESAALASSIHLVCRPRKTELNTTDKLIGDWRDVLQELPQRIHEWMPRLAREGVVGADAIFACLGPALEIFSRYSRVEKTSGAAVTLNEYLEQVWSAVAKEALSMVFEGADASGFEPDARLTAIWLWTLNAGKADTNGERDEQETDDGYEDIVRKVKPTGFILEYDAARKIAQGLGAHLENLGNLVEVSGEQARLLPVAERARYLFGKDEGKVATPQRKRREAQMDLFKVLEAAESVAPTLGETKLARVGETVLDRIHQSMILFAAGRGEALKRLLIEGEAGHDPRFWRLAQALSALYPKGSDEKRWVDGVLARKKGLGL